MSKHKAKEKLMANPIERHDTAAWRGKTKETQPESNVSLPEEREVASAKEWVDTNEK